MGLFYAVCEERFDRAVFCAFFLFCPTHLECEPHSISGAVSTRKDAEKLAENEKNKNDFCHKQGDML